MKGDKDIRIDKYLWAIRLFKTRSLAAKAIEGGKVKFKSANIKSSKKIAVDDIYVIKKAYQTYEIKVLEINGMRQSAEKSKSYYELINFEDNYQPKPNSAFSMPMIQREKGTGRPTKKERRDMNEFTDDLIE